MPETSDPERLLPIDQDEEHAAASDVESVRARECCSSTTLHSQGSQEEAQAETVNKDAEDGASQITGGGPADSAVDLHFPQHADQVEALSGKRSFPN